METNWPTRPHLRVHSHYGANPVIFAEQQWVWRHAPDPIQYGYVSNTVYIRPSNRKPIKAYITVPAEFFQLIDTIFLDDFKALAAEKGTVFYLDQISEKRWLFGIETTCAKKYLDLWAYTTSTLPKWHEVATRRKH